MPTTRRKPLLLKDLRRVFGAKFDVSAYEVTTYDVFLLNLIYLNIANIVPIKKKFFGMKLAVETLRKCKETFRLQSKYPLV
jgi:hypothetical protein